MPSPTRRSLALAIALAGIAGPALGQVKVLLPTTGEVSATLALAGDGRRGKEAFGECQSCHRKDASGRANIGTPRLSGQHASVIIKQLMDIRSGHRINIEMKDYVLEPELTLQNFADIAAYLESLPVAGNLSKGPPELLARGQALYEKDCAACHGAQGEGRPELFHPMVASQHYTYLVRELELIRDGGRGNSNPAMPPILKNYSADDRRAVAAYMAQLPAPARR